MPTALTMRGLCSWTRTRCPRVTSAAITRPSPPHTINDRRCPPPPRPETEPRPRPRPKKRPPRSLWPPRGRRRHARSRSRRRLASRRCRSGLSRTGHQGPAAPSLVNCNHQLSSSVVVMTTTGHVTRQPIEVLKHGGYWLGWCNRT